MTQFLTNVLEEQKKASLSDREYLTFVANLLFLFGKAGLNNFAELKLIDIMDAMVVEQEYIKNPNNVFLAAILQSHAILKWSESV